MKHMPHHMLPEFPLGLGRGLRACAPDPPPPPAFLASYSAKHDKVNYEEIGFDQQAAFYEMFPGPVVDSADIRRDPAAMLSRLCAEIGLPFTERMLSWPAGPKPFDGAWGPHWYGAVHRSTGFAPAEGRLPPVAPEHADHVARALPVYEAFGGTSDPAFDEGGAFCKPAARPTGDPTMTSPRKHLPIETPDTQGERRFTDAGEAVAYLVELYDAATAFPAREVPRRRAGWRHSGRALPGLLSRDPHHHPPPTARWTRGLPSVTWPNPATYMTTVTRPDLFGNYLTQQIGLLIQNHGQPVYIGPLDHAHPGAFRRPERRRGSGAAGRRPGLSAA